MRPNQNHSVVIPAYFLYCAVISPLYPQTGFRPLLMAIVAIAIYVAVQKTEFLWHWVYLAFTLAAYREMDWFTPPSKDHHLENVWITWDRWLLHDFGLQRGIEAFGSALPSLLEASYLLVYAVGPLALAILYMEKRPERAGTLLVYYQTATLIAYALFPYFPSDPPRVVFPGTDLPTITNWVRSSNLVLVNGYGIHSSVFPSAHVSSAFGAAFGMLAAIPEKKWVGCCLLVYATLVAFATVYGRYHYAIDAVAGFLLAVAVAVVLSRRKKVPDADLKAGTAT